MYILRLNTYPAVRQGLEFWKSKQICPNIIIVTRYGEPGTPRISCTWCDSVSQWREQHNYTKLEKIVVYVVYIQCINVYMYIYVYICQYHGISYYIMQYQAIWQRFVFFLYLAFCIVFPICGCLHRPVRSQWSGCGVGQRQQWDAAAAVTIRWKENCAKKVHFVNKSQKLE